MEDFLEPTMNVVNANPEDPFSLMAAFDELCHQLSADASLACRHKPISHWARQGDRRLPYALLQFRVSEVINTPFAELAATPGIGPKKIASLLTLLRRALEDRGPVTVDAVEVKSGEPNDVFDVSRVSESMWEDWRATVRSRGFERQLLGQLTPSLREMPTVIWTTELGDYLDYTLAELRALKTHGEKRIQMVLEVFFVVHSVLDGAGRHPRFRVSLRPEFVGPIEQWIARELERERAPDVQDLRDHLVLPLLNQIQVDGGDTVHQLATGRLGIESQPESVRRQAERLDVTRARIYQLLETCAGIMRVRWPEGRRMLADLAEKLETLDADDPTRVMFEATRWLMFPERVEQRPMTSVISSSAVHDRVSSGS